jgi:hypothetical protein
MKAALERTSLKLPVHVCYPRIDLCKVIYACRLFQNGHIQICIPMQASLECTYSKTLVHVDYWTMDS